MNWLRKIGLAVLVIGISTAIFVVMVSDKETKKEMLRPTLEALGAQLFAAVADDSEKHELEKNYELFVNKAEAQEIPPEEVEGVAAQILNLSSRDSLISGKDALALLTTGVPSIVVSVDSSPGSGYRIDVASPLIPGIPIPIRRPSRIHKSYSPDEMADRLAGMQAFQQEMEQLARESKKRHLIRQKYYFSQTDSGLTVRVDATLRDDLSGEDADLAKKFAELEKKRWLEWEEKHRELKMRNLLNEDSLRWVIDAAAKLSILAQKYNEAFQDSVMRDTRRKDEKEYLLPPSHENGAPKEQPGPR